MHMLVCELPRDALADRRPLDSTLGEFLPERVPHLGSGGEHIALEQAGSQQRTQRVRCINEPRGADPPPALLESGNDVLGGALDRIAHDATYNST
jgi:hypothetical protein